MIKRNYKSRGAVKDTAAKLFFRDKNIIADLCNAFLFHGGKTVSKDNLKEIPTEYNVLVGNKDGSLRTNNRIRDLAYLAYTDGRQGYVFICPEVQSLKDETMPIRVMNYDAMLYEQQTRNEIFKMTKKVLPVVTVVINLSGGPWTGPRSLYDILVEINPFVRQNVPDYSIKIFDPFTLEEKILNLLYTELKIVVNFFRHFKDKEYLKSFSKGKRKVYVSRNAVNLLNVHLNMGLKITGHRRKVEMCKAVRDFEAECEERGRAEGRAEGRAAIQESVVERAVRMHLRYKDIQQLTGLSIWRISRIAKAVKSGK